METEKDYEVEPKRYETVLDKPWEEEKDRLYEFQKKRKEELRTKIDKVTKELYEKGEIASKEEAERLTDVILDNYMERMKIHPFKAKVDQINSDIKKVIERQYIPLIRESGDIEKETNQLSKEEILKDIQENIKERGRKK
jgi:RNase adaptor protein for sRNA GlmZ degradation